MPSFSKQVTKNWYMKSDKLNSKDEGWGKILFGIREELKGINSWFKKQGVHAKRKDDVRITIFVKGELLTEW